MFEIEEDYDLCADAINGAEAVRLARECRPDLVILDLTMPVMNGYDAAREIKKFMPDVPIILFTMHAPSLKSQLLGNGSPIDRIVAKSDSENLMNQVRSLAPV
jgi:two-component system nitrate/nitrite response regulator NarL